MSQVKPSHRDSTKRGAHGALKLTRNLIHTKGYEYQRNVQNQSPSKLKWKFFFWSHSLTHSVALGIFEVSSQHTSFDPTSSTLDLTQLSPQKWNTWWLPKKKSLLNWVSYAPLDTLSSSSLCLSIWPFEWAPSPLAKFCRRRRL